jgi:hypothetical protein
MRLTLFALAVLALAGARPAPSQPPAPVPPYLFILFDTSGSMNWAPPCTAAQFTAGQCNFLCPTGDCFVSRQGDDPASKFFQLKVGLYSVLANTDDFQLGFASFNQDALGIRAKHWLYQAGSNGVLVPGWGPFPAAGAQEVFGFLWNCDTGSNDHEIGCVSTKPADLIDPWEIARVQRLPKGGQSLIQDVFVFIRHQGVTYRVRYRPLGGVLGGMVPMRIDLERCQNTSCTIRSLLQFTTVNWTPVGQFLSWDNAPSNPSRTDPLLSYFAQSFAGDADAAGTCASWDPNNDTTMDSYNGYSLRWPTLADSRGAALQVGDVVPWDWSNDHRQEILGRLAPSTVLNPLAPPDFGIASYLRDTPVPGETFLRLSEEHGRPLIAVGSTPHQATLRSFRTWYAGCPSGSCTPGAGWKGIAAVQDPDWTLRRKAVLLLTDGDESCSADPCDAVASSLYTEEGIEVYVVAYGADPTLSPQVQCIANAGGTGQAWFPQTLGELDAALTSILEQLLFTS